MKIIRVILSETATSQYDLLEKSQDKINSSIFNSVKNKIFILKSDFHYGNPIAKNLIPLEYTTKYSASNLFRVELASYWRMLYTITNSENPKEVIVFILDIINHEDYNEKFGYSKK